MSKVGACARFKLRNANIFLRKVCGEGENFKSVWRYKMFSFREGVLYILAYHSLHTKNENKSVLE